MMVPRNRLLLWVAMLLPFTVVAPLVPAFALLSYGMMGMLIVCVAGDAFLAARRLDGVSVELPEVVRFSRDREGKIPMILHVNEGLRELRLGLPLPPEIPSSQEDMVVALPEGNPHSQIFWTCTPRVRGNFKLEGCHVEASSPLGFWGVRRVLSAATEIRVYPNLMEERKRLAALFLNRGNFGVHSQRVMGQGREFEKLRDYVSGDSFDQIHWKATAKRGRPVTKVFQVERTQEVYVLIDSSRLSGRMSGGQPAMERFISAALVMALVAEQQGDLFGLITFSDRVTGFVRARNGKAHYDACRDALYTLQTTRVTPDFEELCTFVRLRLRRRALLLLLTDLDDPVLVESLARNIDLIGRQHLIRVCSLKSSMVAPLFQSGDVESVDQIYERLGGHLLWRQLQELEKVLQRHGVRLLNLDGERMSSQLVTHYLSLKQRQVL